MISIPFHNLNEVPKFNPVIQVASEFPKVLARKKLEHKSGMSPEYRKHAVSNGCIILLFPPV